MAFNLLSVAVRNLKRRSFRTIVLIISIGLLVSMLVFGVSFVTSVTASIERASARLGADLLVVPTGAVNYAEEVLLEMDVDDLFMDKSIVERVKKIEGVVDVTYQTYLNTIPSVCCDIPTAKVVLFDQETDFIVMPWLNKIIGRQLEKNEVIIGSTANENFGLLDVDRSVFFNIVFSFVGVLEETGTGLDNVLLMSDVNREAIIASSDMDLDSNGISIAFVRVEPGYDPEKVGYWVEGEILEVDVIPRTNIGMRIINNLRDISKVFIITTIMASLLSMLLAWSVFSAIANERIREIGIMRAIGARGSHVMLMFMLEVLVLGVLGSLLGITFGAYLSFSLSKTFVLLQELPVGLTMGEKGLIGLMGLLAGTGICLIGAFSSILRFKKLDPLNALKEG
ncbi:ABC transporter permease [Nitrospirota bacterium]